MITADFQSQHVQYRACVLVPIWRWVSL